MPPPPVDHEPGWEWVYFASEIARGLDKNDAPYDDFQRGVVRTAGHEVPDPLKYARDCLDHLNSITDHVNQAFTPEASEKAFGPPGKPGDQSAIVAWTADITQLFTSFIDWAQEIRSSIIPDNWRATYLALSSLVSLPLKEYVDFSDMVSWQTHEVVEATRASRKPRYGLDITLKLTADPKTLRDVEEAINQLATAATSGDV